MSQITLVIPVKNEAKKLPRCIASVSDLGPIVVVAGNPAKFVKIRVITKSEA